MSHLESNHICAFMKNEFPPAAGAIPPINTQPDNNKDETKAMKIIHDVLKKQSALHAPWVCPQCGEHLDGQFKICWKCGFTKE